ncbi:MAG: hypothetical protein OXF79_10495 [Chloroflexi bacterium]|nr:hypothetical protein [Chloroflexota bacterium]
MLGMVERLAIAALCCIAVCTVTATIRIRILSREPALEPAFRSEALLIFICLSPFFAMTIFGAWKGNIVFLIGIGLCLFWASVFVYEAWDKARWARLKRRSRKMPSAPVDQQPPLASNPNSASRHVQRQFD